MNNLNTSAIRDRVRDWLNRDPDPKTREELLALDEAGSVAELSARFEGRLQFGTAGLRGVVGAGPMRMNRLVVRETSAGLGSYVMDTVSNALERGVVVTYDARPDSRQFAEDTASVLLGLGYKVYLTTAAQPTPLGAYGVLHLGTAAGIVVTASHNPPQYNGYKVYWENGAQIIPPHDADIAACIDAAAKAEIPWTSLEEGRAAGRLVALDEAFVETYRARVLDYAGLDAASQPARIRVAYTAMHGVGAETATALLRASGICDVDSVVSQHEPDGSFPTVDFPNPEEPGAMDAVVALAKTKESALACANDPDADRLAVAVRDDSGEYEMLTGDQVGVLLGSYLLDKSRSYTPIVCASLVSSRMLEAIARDAGALYFETLTGFKWLSNVALKHETDDRRFLYAYEEALGYALGQVVRDKDGLSALLLFAEMTAELAARGETVLDRLDALYRRFGLYASRQESIATQPGGPSITAALRAAKPPDIGGQPIVSTKDLDAGTHVFADGRVEPVDFYPSDVLIYYLADESRVIVRPSGTEPKTKCYYEVIDSIETDSDSARQRADARMVALASAHQESLASLV